VSLHFPLKYLRYRYETQNINFKHHFRGCIKFWSKSIDSKTRIHKISIVVIIFPLQISDMISKLFHISKAVKKNSIMIPNIINYVLIQLVPLWYFQFSCRKHTHTFLSDLNSTQLPNTYQNRKSKVGLEQRLKQERHLHQCRGRC